MISIQPDQCDSNGALLGRRHRSIGCGRCIIARRDGDRHRDSDCVRVAVVDQEGEPIRAAEVKGRRVDQIGRNPP